MYLCKNSYNMQTLFCLVFSIIIDESYIWFYFLIQTLLYFLANDTIEIREQHTPNDGRDNFPLLLRRQRVPRNPNNVPRTYTKLFQELYHFFHFNFFDRIWHNYFKKIESRYFPKDRVRIIRTRRRASSRTGRLGNWGESFHSWTVCYLSFRCNLRDCLRCSPVCVVIW